MLNLQQLQAKTINIVWVDGETISLNQPTVKIIRKIEVSGGELEGVVDAVHEIINNNASGRKFSKKEIEELPMHALKAIASEVAEFKAEADNNPN
ncbi:phage tail assembly protein [Listeria monocytogenes]|uniref:phage tail assembly protein n=1 Tax=Listeria monocytogenes TaxID=1639 RepID=UPI0011EDA449|nr:phage tail assembly protein [Listeria monocytogenes]EAV9864765.1 phage tail assembly protein [Listeria monocytogenes]EKZ0882715.1 phage tail assembly protein [Listeria monocytogenes]TYU25352.1 phage tail assembly protein [Listeria monocytogenes]TYU32092.1 phage tail assembly protein [Listeria monocytogenes]